MWPVINTLHFNIEREIIHSTNIQQVSMVRSTLLAALFNIISGVFICWDPL